MTEQSTKHRAGNTGDQAVVFGHDEANKKVVDLLRKTQGARSLR